MYEKPSKRELESILTELQFDVTRKAATERAFPNEYRNNHEKGITFSAGRKVMPEEGKRMS